MFNIIDQVRFQSHGYDNKIDILRDGALSSLIDTDRRFRSPYYRHREGQSHYPPDHMGHQLGKQPSSKYINFHNRSISQTFRKNYDFVQNFGNIGTDEEKLPPVHLLKIFFSNSITLTPFRPPAIKRRRQLQSLQFEL